MARHAVSIMYPLSKERGNTIHLNIDPSIPDRVIGDEGRTRQVLLNLLSNAIKFTENGNIRLRVESKREADRQLSVCFSVSDNGIGIPLEAQPHIFVKFFQADASIRRRFGGTGLGLTISAHIVEQMDGKIGFVSTPGLGTTFHFELPFACDEPEFILPVPQPTGGCHRLRVLSAEDSATNQLVIQHYLREAGHDCVGVADGQEAVEAVRSSSYDMILMDVQMPKMDGIEATRWIRDTHGPNRDVPIVIVTAHAMAGDREKFLAAGADDVLHKPITPAALHEALARLARRVAA